LNRRRVRKNEDWEHSLSLLKKRLRYPQNAVDFGEGKKASRPKGVGRKRSRRRRKREERKKRSEKEGKNYPSRENDNHLFSKICFSSEATAGKVLWGRNESQDTEWASGRSYRGEPLKGQKSMNQTIDKYRGSERTYRGKRKKKKQRESISAITSARVFFYRKPHGRQATEQKKKPKTRDWREKMPWTVGVFGPSELIVLDLIFASMRKLREGGGKSLARGETKDILRKGGVKRKNLVSKN